LLAYCPAVRQRAPEACLARRPAAPPASTCPGCASRPGATADAVSATRPPRSRPRLGPGPARPRPRVPRAHPSWRTTHPFPWPARSRAHSAVATDGRGSSTPDQQLRAKYAHSSAPRAWPGSVFCVLAPRSRSRAGRSLRSARISICRTRSRLTASDLATSSSVCPPPGSKPKRSRRDLSFAGNERLQRQPNVLGQEHRGCDMHWVGCMGVSDAVAETGITIRAHRGLERHWLQGPQF
jgi:hypothetical protein